MITWSVSRISIKSEVMWSSSPAVSKSCFTELGRLSTPKWKWEASTCCESSTVNADGISASSPSGRPSRVAHSRVKPSISEHAPPAARCFFQ